MAETVNARLMGGISIMNSYPHQHIMTRDATSTFSNCPNFHVRITHHMELLYAFESKTLMALIQVNVSTNVWTNG